LCEAAQEMESLWVNFKLFGVLGLTLVFVLAQAFWIARHAEHPQESESTDH
jgi:intracellular septation protein